MFRNSARKTSLLHGLSGSPFIESAHDLQILHPNRMRETGRSALFQGLVFKGARLRQVDAGDLDDGLPRGFLAGAIVEVWVALRLNWA